MSAIVNEYELYEIIDEYHYNDIVSAIKSSYQSDIIIDKIKYEFNLIDEDECEDECECNKNFDDIIISQTDNKSINESFFIEKLMEMSQKYHTVSNEDEQTIINIIKKYV